MRLRMLFAVLLMVGCAGAPPADKPHFAPITPTPADKAVVYVYRPHAKLNNDGYADIFLNGEKKFALWNRGYGVFTLPPGPHEIRVEGDLMKTAWYPPPAVRKLEVEAGREYYVRVIPVQVSFNPHKQWFPEAQTQITLVPKEEALNAIAQTQLNQ